MSGRYRPVCVAIDNCVADADDVNTTDNNPSGMDGGNISKDLILVPVKTGTTIFKLYKFWKQEKTAADSAGFTSYKIEVKQ